MLKEKTTMKVGFVIVYVSDYAKALDFYTKQLELQIDYADGKNWAQFKTGEDVSLAIEACSPERMECGAKLVGRFVGVTLVVENILDVCERLSKNGVELSGKPEKQNWGGTLVNIRDLDGNVLTLMETDE